MKFALFTIPVEGPERDLRIRETNDFLAQVEVRRYNAQIVATMNPQEQASNEKVLLSEKINGALRRWRSEEAAKMPIW